MTISRGKLDACKEIDRRGGVLLTTEEHERLARVPVDVIRWIGDFAERVFERGHAHGAMGATPAAGRPTLPTPEEVAERSVQAGQVPVGFLLAARRIVAAAIRTDRTCRPALCATCGGWGDERGGGSCPRCGGSGREPTVELASSSRGESMAQARIRAANVAHSAIRELLDVLDAERLVDPTGDRAAMRRRHLDELRAALRTVNAETAVHPDPARTS
jgi:hypothetical protein